MNLSPEERAIGRDNYYEALGVTRRDFLRGVVGAGAVSGVGLGAMYFGYGSQTDPNKGLDDPVRIGVIGTGDEGGVLIGSLNAQYVQVVAIADIRPSSRWRAFHGDWSSPGTLKARPGLNSVYGWGSEDEARKHVKVYEGHYRDLLEDSDVEAVIIALPLFLHHPVALEAMKAGKHVLTEKLMAHNVAQCKAMGRVANGDQAAIWRPATSVTTACCTTTPCTCCKLGVARRSCTTSAPSGTAATCPGPRQLAAAAARRREELSVVSQRRGDYSKRSTTLSTEAQSRPRKRPEPPKARAPRNGGTAEPRQHATRVLHRLGQRQGEVNAVKDFGYHRHETLYRQ